MLLLKKEQKNNIETNVPQICFHTLKSES